MVGAGASVAPPASRAAPTGPAPPPTSPGPPTPPTPPPPALQAELPGLDEIMANQATMNIGIIGHVAHGKTTVVRALSTRETACFKDEKEKNRTIKPVEERQTQARVWGHLLDHLLDFVGPSTHTMHPHGACVQMG